MITTPDGDLVGIVEEAIDLGSLINAVAAHRCGAIATFLGTVRSPNQGQAVSYIDYEGYAGMVEAQMQAIAEALRLRHELHRLALAHRLGRLEPGDASIAIVASSAHRRAALDACAEALELCKKQLPIWKFEVNAAGGTYVVGRNDAIGTL